MNLEETYAFDQNWADSMDKKSQQTLERLEMELNGHKTNLIKESIRVCAPSYFCHVISTIEL